MPLPARGTAAAAQALRNQKQWQASLLLWQQALSPVSYTHLDVYKRQAFGFVILALPVFLLERILGDQWGFCLLYTSRCV